jgi:hypothetical protein
MGPLDVYTDQESDRLSRIMRDDPHSAASELRGQLQQLDPITASQLIQKTKDNEFVGGLGDLQIQVEYTQNGCDSGFRNVTMATPDGVEQIAEIQTNGGNCGPNGYDNGYAPGGNPLAYAAGMIVGDLLWGQRNGYDFSDPCYSGWQQRQEWRENDWRAHNDEFRQNWSNPNYRNQYQDQPWQQHAWQQNNTYITNNRVSNTTINETIINNNGQRQQPGARPIYSNPGQGPITYAPGTPGQPGHVGPGGYRPVAPTAPYEPRPVAPHPVVGGGRPRYEGNPQPQQTQQQQLQQDRAAEQVRLQQLRQQEVDQIRQHQHPNEIQQQMHDVRQQQHNTEIQQYRAHLPAEAPRQQQQPQQQQQQQQPGIPPKQHR